MTQSQMLIQFKIPLFIVLLVIVHFISIFYQQSNKNKTLVEADFTVAAHHSWWKATLRVCFHFFFLRHSQYIQNTKTIMILCFE